MKKILSAVLILFLMVGSAFGYNLEAPRSKTKQRKVVKVAKPPAIPYDTYIVADAETGVILEGKDITKQRPQASITKIMLACVVADKINVGEISPDDLITAPREVIGVGGTSVFLKPGEVFTLDELMVAVMVRSANDAAYTVAKHIAGSTEAFADLMNAKAKELGMLNTVYHSVNGLPPHKGEEDNLTSCLDMFILAQEALKYPKVREWVSIEYTIFRKGVIINHNRLLAKMPDVVDGIKTGFTQAAGYNIVVTGKNDERRIIVVVLGATRSSLRDDFAQGKLTEYLTIGEGG